jgi:hypothetical protein
MIKQLTGDYVSLAAKEFLPHGWFQHNSGTAHITYDFQVGLVGVNSMVFGQRYITFSTTSILDFSPSSSASKIS